MKGMFLKKCDIYFSKWAKVAEKFQLSMTKLGAHDEIRWNDVLLTEGIPHVTQIIPCLS